MASTITVSATDASLFHVATRALGNPFQGFAVTPLDGVSDPSPSGPATAVTLLRRPRP